MYREVAALRTLDNTRVPHLVESNTDLFEDQTIDLYLIMEYIEGEKLSARRSPCNVTDACEAITKIIQTVAACHAASLLHRDLKPDNIICRSGYVTDPVLIDFGQSFNWADLTDPLATPTGAHLGNRFMQLPELHTTGADQHNPLSDIAFCVGLFFFLITHQHPEALRDANGNPPHERQRARELLEMLPPGKRRVLNRIFAKGFEPNFDFRYQSFNDLQHDIALLLDPAIENQPQRLADMLTSLSDSLANDRRHQMHARAAEACTKIRTFLQEAVNDLNAFGNGIRAGMHPGNPDPRTGSTPFQIRIDSHYYPGRSLIIILNARLEADDFVVSSNHQEIVRMQALAAELLEIVKTKINRFIADALTKFLSPPQ